MNNYRTGENQSRLPIRWYSVGMKPDSTEYQWYTASWNYFSLLSGQRMQMLHFFILIEIFVSGAFITLICLETRLHWAEIAVSILISLIAFVFMGLDRRTKNMIHECEKIMTTIEDASLSRPDFHPITSVNNRAKSFLTYSKLIRSLQVVFMAAGIMSGFLVFLHLI